MVVTEAGPLSRQRKVNAHARWNAGPSRNLLTNSSVPD